MLSGEIKQIFPVFFNRISTRLSFFYLVFTLGILLSSYFVIFHVADKFLVDRDHEQIDGQLSLIEEAIDKNSRDETNLQRLIESSNFSNISSKYFITIKKNGSSYFSKNFPESDNFEAKIIQHKIDSQNEDSRFYIASKTNDENALEVKKRTVGSFEVFVGKSTDDRDDILENLKKYFAGMFALAGSLMLFGCFFITERILAPFVRLYQTIQKVQKGELGARVELPTKQDEIYYISYAFNTMLDQVQQLLSTMNTTLDAVAHDFKTPLSQMRVSAELALESADMHQLKNANYTVIEACDQLITLVNSLLMQSRVDSGLAKLNRENFDMNKIVHEVEDLYQFLAEDKGISFLVKSDKCFINGDLQLIKKVIANLVDNAIKYSPPNSEVILSSESVSSKEVMAHLNSENFNEKNILWNINQNQKRAALELPLNVESYVQIRVVDQGIGISEDEYLKIWERLYRSDKSRHLEGFGLGLSIVKSIVFAHHGYIHLKSHLGKGSCFTVFLPLS